MHDLAEKIAQADSTEIDALMKAVLHRYSALFPEQEVSILSVRKGDDWNEQLDSIIHMLQKMKTFP